MNASLAKPNGRCEPSLRRWRSKQRPTDRQCPVTKSIGPSPPRPASRPWPPGPHEAFDVSVRLAKARTERHQSGFGSMCRRPVSLCPRVTEIRCRTAMFAKRSCGGTKRRTSGLSKNESIKRRNLPMATITFPARTTLLFLNVTILFDRRSGHLGSIFWIRRNICSVGRCMLFARRKFGAPALVG